MPLPLTDDRRFVIGERVYYPKLNKLLIIERFDWVPLYRDRLSTLHCWHYYAATSQQPRRMHPTWIPEFDLLEIDENFTAPELEI